MMLKEFRLAGSAQLLKHRTNATLTARGSPYQVRYAGRWRRVWWGADDLDWFMLDGKRVPIRAKCEAQERNQ